MAHSTPATVLTGLRLAVGVGSWATPTLAGQAFGIKIADNIAGPYLARLFGARDVALAAGALASDGQSRRMWLQTGLACDVADAIAAALAVRSGGLGKVSGTLAGGTAVAAAVLGILALWQEDSGPATAEQ